MPTLGRDAGSSGAPASVSFGSANSWVRCWIELAPQLLLAQDLPTLGRLEGLCGLKLLLVADVPTLGCDAASSGAPASPSFGSAYSWILGWMELAQSAFRLCWAGSGRNFGTPFDRGVLEPTVLTCPLENEAKASLHMSRNKMIR